MEVYVLIQKFKENDWEFLKSLSAEEKFFPVLELFEEEFEHFDFAKSYTYLFDAFPLLLISKYKAFKHKEEAYKRFQMLRLSIRKLLLKDKENSFFKKMMGKFDVLSLELANALDYKYDEMKLDLLKHLIFHVRNLEVLERIVVEKPHQINSLKRAGDNYNLFMFQECFFKKVEDSILYRHELRLKEVASFLNHQNEVLENFFEEQSLLLKK